MDIYSEILSALETEESIMLATVISTSGSTPASALSKMLVKRGGVLTVGTIGGGCMEGEVVQHANRIYGSGKAEIHSFELNEDETESGLICGGTLEVLLEPITREHIKLFTEVKAIRDEGEDCVVTTLVSPEGTIAMKEVLPIAPQHTTEWGSRVVKKMEKLVFAFSDPEFQSKPISDIVKKAFHNQQTKRMKTEQGEFFLEPVRGTPSLIIFGGGHVSKYISSFASIAGFQVTIVDDREKYANPVRFPEATATLALDYGQALEKLKIRESTYVVIVTRGHQYDEEILKRIIKTPARYIGMIGSKRKVLTTYEHLLPRGISIEALKRVHAPIGIEIGAVTAEEIGVSIVAQLINERRGGVPLRNKSAELNEQLRAFEQKKSIA
ncbi:MAG: XdhC family protein [Ignavibacteriae bacterium]|nr:XdhC family protein [Ignavibacteriota bacterium]